VIKAAGDLEREDRGERYAFRSLRPLRSIVDIEPSGGMRALQVGELWRYRELLYFLGWRDVKVRYKQTALGAAWAVLQPLLTMAVFAIFLGRLAHVPSDGLPYPLFSFAGLVPWTYFATAVMSGATSVVGSQQLISKVYFPRLLVPLAATATPLVDFVISLATLAAMLAWYHVTPGAAVAWLPLFALLALATAFAVSLWLSALMVAYRDVRYVVPFFMQFWMFATPVAYPASLVPAEWRVLYGLNPMTGVVEGFRWALAGGPAPGPTVIASAAAVAVLLVSGLYFFRRLEGTFADVI
jgi:lipopolysaccharide transport system permease protein